MDISTFRWILIIVGVAIIAGILLLGNPQKGPRRRASRKRNKRRGKRQRKARSRRKATRRQVRREPTLEADAEPGDGEADTEDPAQGDLLSDSREQAPPPRPGPKPDKIVLLYLKARDNRRIAGVDLIDSALKSGMVFGAQDIFHRVYEGDDRPIFSMANLENPGNFDKDNWNVMETRGVTLFMTLPGPVGALDAWDSMLAAGRRLAELLHADLLAEDKTPFTRTREGEIREELRAYERSQLPDE